MTANTEKIPIKFTLIDLDNNKKQSEFESLDEMIEEIKNNYNFNKST